ncbi:MAG: enoyl-CoA hydratase/isomerase family protein [Hylemonella sp.]|nr:enoyl-CoA hydratase/isomerase family protein [Hylemonella sp.]MDP1936114.1 enoyl-CoA hydratase/isomerase family protein [Hylemonella sp.]
MNHVISYNCPEVLTEIRGHVGCITLNRPRALNALSLPMIRALNATLMAWRDDAQVQAVAIRGMGKEGPFGAFCAGGDIRFFHQAVMAANAELEDFFTEEYSLNHLIHHYPKPYIAFMDGIVMGGGMGISQGAKLRIVTPRTKMAMPETNIGLFPDVAGGYFLGRCPGRSGEWLALTGDVIDAGNALAMKLADVCFDPSLLGAAWERLAAMPRVDEAALNAWAATHSIACEDQGAEARADMDRYFGLDSVANILHALDQADSDWARANAETLRKRSPLMMAVTLELVRRARGMTLAEDLRLERDIVRHCFTSLHLDRFGPATETMEGIRALVIDKDQNPRWNPARIEEVTPEMVAGFFVSPWPAYAHPLRDLA